MPNITIQEIKRAIRKMKRDKAPGKDGIESLGP